MMGRVSATAAVAAVAFFACAWVLLPPPRSALRAPAADVASLSASRRRAAVGAFWAMGSTGATLGALQGLKT